MKKVIFMAPGCSGEVIIGFGALDQIGRLPIFLRGDGEGGTRSLETEVISPAQLQGDASQILIEKCPLLLEMAKSNTLMLEAREVKHFGLTEMAGAHLTMLLGSVLETLLPLPSLEANLKSTIEVTEKRVAEASCDEDEVDDLELLSMKRHADPETLTYFPTLGEGFLVLSSEAENGKFDMAEIAMRIRSLLET